MSTEGKEFDRVSMTWLEPAEMARRRADWQELAFRMQPNQGQLAAPMIISDCMRDTQSMLDGKFYDSKSNLRRTYKQGGVEEVGNDPAYTDPERVKPKARPKADRKAILEDVRRAISQANLTTSTPGDDIKIKDWTPSAAPQKLHTFK